MKSLILAISLAILMPTAAVAQNTNDEEPQIQAQLHEAVRRCSEAYRASDYHNVEMWCSMAANVTLEQRQYITDTSGMGPDDAAIMITEAGIMTAWVSRAKYHDGHIKEANEFRVTAIQVLKQAQQYDHYAANDAGAEKWIQQLSSRYH